MPAISKIYSEMFELVQHIDKMTDFPEDDRESVRRFVDNRWKRLHTDVHNAGFILDPQHNLGGIFIS